MQGHEIVNILMVDDRPENLIALEATLLAPEYNLVTARSGPEALRLIEERPFALIILDIQMPGMDGFETARIIKSQDKNKNIPIIFITAIYKEDPHVKRGYEVGAIDYFGKPFDPDILKKKVEIYTDFYRNHLKLQLNEAELKARNRELEYHATELTTVMEAVPEAIYIVRDHRITRNNAAASSLFGFESYEDMRQDLDSFIQKVNMRDAKTGQPLVLEKEPSYRALNGKHSSMKVVVRNVRTGKDITVLSTAIPFTSRMKLLERWLWTRRSSSRVFN